MLELLKGITFAEILFWPGLAMGIIIFFIALGSLFAKKKESLGTFLVLTLILIVASCALRYLGLG